GYGGGVGTSSRSRSPYIVAGIAVALLCVIFGFIAQLFFGNSLPLPAETVILSYLSPRTELPANSPDIWKQTRANTPHLPVFVGYVKDDSGLLQPFGMNLGFFHWKQNGFEYTSESMVSVFHVLGRIRSLFSSTWLGVWPETFAKFKGNESVLNVYGVVKAKNWKTNLPAPQIIDYPTTVISSMNRISVRAIPDLWPKLQRQFETRDISFGNLETPTIVQWSQSEDQINILLEFDTPPLAQTRERIAADAGIVETATFQLPDGSIGHETRAPKMTDEDQTFELKDGRVLKFWDRFIYLGSPNPDFTDPLPAPCSDLPAFAIFDETTILNLTDAFELPHILPSEKLSFVPNKNEIDICW
ncbi:MAG: hypothetical protein NUV81_00500, partial [bacterium]|nr:hypothetical protein [bacterium]